MTALLDSLFDNLPSGAVSIGNFDGVHIGHAKLIERLKFHAARVGGPSIVFTFDPHPAVLLHPEKAPRPLTWKNRKARLLSNLGVDVILFYPTDMALLSMDAQTFFQDVLVKRLHASALVEGDNFVFGRDRRGDAVHLQRWAEESKMELEIVGAVEYKNERVSSSFIRQLIAQGDVDRANEILTAPYRIRGMVVHGDARGRTLGFPTANLEAVDVLLPGEGAYAADVYLAAAGVAESTVKQTQKFRAMVHIGKNVTFNQNSPRVEVHLLDFNADIYGKVLKVDFLHRIRGVKKFDSVEELKSELIRDAQIARDCSKRQAAF